MKFKRSHTHLIFAGLLVTGKMKPRLANHLFFVLVGCDRLGLLLCYFELEKYNIKCDAAVMSKTTTGWRIAVLTRSYFLSLTITLYLSYF